MKKKENTMGIITKFDRYHESMGGPGDYSLEKSYNKAVEVAARLGLRPPMAIPKGTQKLFDKTKHDSIRFIKEIDGTWDSGVIFVFHHVDGSFRLWSRGLDFREESYKTPENVKMVEALVEEVSRELNSI